MLFAPLVTAFGSYAPATAPALVFVGALIASGIRRIPWEDATEAVPAFATIIGIPLTFSIAHGIAFRIRPLAAGQTRVRTRPGCATRSQPGSSGAGRSKPGAPIAPRRAGAVAGESWVSLPGGCLGLHPDSCVTIGRSRNRNETPHPPGSRGPFKRC